MGVVEEQTGKCIVALLRDRMKEMLRGYTDSGSFTEEVRTMYEGEFESMFGGVRDNVKVVTAKRARYRTYLILGSKFEKRIKHCLCNGVVKNELIVAGGCSGSDIFLGRRYFLCYV